MLWELTYWRMETKGGERTEKGRCTETVFLHFLKPYLILCDISYCCDFITLGTPPSLLHEMQSATTTKLGAFLPR